MTKIIDLSIKEKIYKSKQSRISILNDFNLEVVAGEKIAIVGESGAGKSSLLNIIGLIDRNYDGEYTLFGSPTNQLDTSKLAQWRNKRIGFVLQESALINSLTIEDMLRRTIALSPQHGHNFQFRINEFTAHPNLHPHTTIVVCVLTYTTIVVSISQSPFIFQN